MNAAEVVITSPCVLLRTCDRAPEKRGVKSGMVLCAGRFLVSVNATGMEQHEGASSWIAALLNTLEDGGK